MNKIQEWWHSWTWFQIIWLGAFSAVAVWLSLFQWGESIFSFSVFLTGVICVVLVAKGSIWNYAWGTYNVGGYAYLSWQNGFYGELMLNAGFYLPMQLVGFLMWKDKMDDGEVQMKRLNITQIAVWGCFSVAAILAYGMWLETLKGQNNPFYDSTTTVLSIVAMIMMARRYADQWALWIIINIVSIIMWSLRLESGVDGAAAMVTMWSAYLVNAVYGYIKWLQGSVPERSEAWI